MSGKIGGDFDFSGQEYRDDTAATDTPDGEAREPRDVGPIDYTKLANEHNGSAGSSRIIDPTKVKGSNP